MADQVSFEDEAGFQQLIKEVRNEKNETDWVLFTYDGPKSNKIILVGKGNGGANELVASLQDDMIAYGLVRKTDKIDDSVTVKFAFVSWLGENANRMLKARVGTHTGAIRKFIGQFHVDITCSSKDEISDQIIQDKIMDTSGSGSKVVDRSTGAKEARNYGGSAISKSGSGGKTGSLEFVNKDELKTQIAEVRKGSLNWVMFTYDPSNNNAIVAHSQGNGGAEELVEKLNDEMVGYAIVRKIEVIDQSETIKFAFIRFVGDNVPRMLKARLGTHTGAVNEFFTPYHVTLDVTQKSEITDDAIMKLIQSASGTKVNVLEGKKEVAPTTSIGRTSNGIKPGSSNTTRVPGAVPKNSSAEQNVKFIDKDAVKADIADVRNDATETNWVLVGYEGGKGNTLVTLGKGSGGVEEMVQLLNDKIAAYGLVRKTEKIDETLAVKFAHIIWVGENIDRMHRARLGTHKGNVTELFSPYHVDINATQLGELTDESVMQKIQDASGTAIKVRSK